MNASKKLLHVLGITQIFERVVHIIRFTPNELKGKLRICLLVTAVLPLIDLCIVFGMYVLVLALQGDHLAVLGITMGSSQLPAIICLFIGLTMIRQLLEFLSVQQTRNFTQAFFRQYSFQLLSHYLQLSWMDYSKETRAVKLKHLTATSLDSAYSFQVMFHFLGSFFSLILLVGTMLVIAPTVALIGFISLILFNRLTHRLMKDKVNHATQKHNIHEQHFYDRLHESLSMFREIKLFGVEDVMLKRVQTELNQLSDAKLKLSVIPQIPRLTLEFIFTAAIGVGILVFVLTNNGETARLIASMASFTILARRLIPSMAILLSSFAELEGASEQLKILNREIETGVWKDSFFTRKALSTNVVLELSNVTFSYNEKQLLENQSFMISIGELIAITGETGRGKSTLLMIIAGLIQPSTGDVIRSESFIPTHQDLAYVPQETSLLSGTILDNILFGAPLISEKHVWEAVEKSSLTPFIQQLPEGLNTYVGDNGVFLSGGQRQRLGIARALYRKPRLLLLDEATSALDEQTEYEIMTNIKEWMKDGSVLFITHRKESANVHASRTIEL